MEFDLLKKKLYFEAFIGNLIKTDGNQTSDVLHELNLAKEEASKVSGKLINEIKQIKPVKLGHFDIPSHWAWIKITDLGEIISGGTPKTKVRKYWDGGTVPWITPADLSGNKNKYVSIGKRNITEIGLRESSAKLLPKGSIVFSTRAPIGYVSIVENNLATNQGFKSIIPYNLKYSEYIYHFLMFDADRLNGIAKGVTFKELSKSEFSRIIIPVPPQNEMDMIIKKINKVMVLIEEVREKVSLTFRYVDKLKKQIIHEAIQLINIDEDQSNNKRTIESVLTSRSKYTDVFDKKFLHQYPFFTIPSNWKWMKMSDVSQVISDGTHKTPEYVEYGVPFLSIRNISNGYLDLENVKFISEDTHVELSKRIKPQKNDILFCRIGTLGKAFVVETNENFDIFVSLGLIRPNELVNPYFLMYVINSKFGDDVIDLIKASGVHTNKINLRDMREVYVPIPPLEEQIRIINKVRKRMELIEELEVNIKKELNRNFKLSQDLIFQDMKIKRGMNHMVIDIDDNRKSDILYLVGQYNGSIEAGELWKISSIKCIDDFYQHLSSLVNEKKLKVRRDGILSFVEVYNENS